MTGRELSRRVKEYRTELRREVNMHCGVCRSCRPATQSERIARARRLYERATGHAAPVDKTKDEIIDALVNLADIQEAGSHA